MYRLCIALILAICLAATGALAQDDYPTETVTIVVPFPAGGGTDTMGRLLAERLQKRFGKPFIVENRPGAGSLIGVDYVAKADPNGYMLLLATSSMITNVVLGEKKPYDPRGDFDPIRLLTIAPAVLTVNPKFPASDLKGFIDTVKKNPGKYKYASYGKRTQAHLTAVILQDLTKLKIRHIPYKGGSPAITATIRGETDLVIPSVVPASGRVKSGQLKALAIASSKRSPILPDVATFAEQGVNFEQGTWFGVVAPHGTPKAVISKLDAAIAEFLADEEFRNKLQSRGAIVADKGQKEFGAFMNQEIERWTKLLASGLLD